MNHFLVQKMLEGARRLGHQPDTRQPITLSVLHKLIRVIPAITHIQPQRALLKAMFLLAFHGFLRVGEFTVRSHNTPSPNTLQVQDCSVQFRKKQVSAIALLLRNSKHNQAKPFHITIPATGSPNCPADALHQYLLTTRPKPGPLFQNTSYLPITRSQFQTHLKKCLEAARIDTSLYKTHSFRIGAATEAVTTLQLPDHEIQRLGRWNSNAFKSYVRMPKFTSKLIST